jgi:hypothetical protein
VRARDDTNEEDRTLTYPQKGQLALYHVHLSATVLAANQVLHHVLRRAMSSSFLHGNIYVKRKEKKTHQYYVYFNGPPIGESLAITFGKPTTQLNFRRIPSMTVPGVREAYKLLNGDKAPGAWIPLSGEPHHFSLFRNFVPDKYHAFAVAAVSSLHVRSNTS